MILGGIIYGGEHERYIIVSLKKNQLDLFEHESRSKGEPILYCEEEALNILSDAHVLTPENFFPVQVSIEDISKCKVVSSKSFEEGFVYPIKIKFTKDMT